MNSRNSSVLSRDRTIRWFLRSFGSLLSLFLLANIFGCAAVGPDYVPVEIKAAKAWNSGLTGGLTDKTTSPSNLAAWWKTLNDPILSSLMDRAVTNNLGLKEARSRVREARAQRGISNAYFYPTLDASGRINRSSGSKETGGGQYRTLYSAGFDAGWELDLFGGVRRSVEAAEADLQASRYDLRNVLVSLLAEVALNYVEARTYQTQLAVNNANLEAQEETHDLTQARFLAGLSDELAVHQARYNLETTRARIPTLRTGLEEALNRLAVLLGECPGTIHKTLEEAVPIPVTPLEVAVGVPADTLRRRPDIHQAERKLAAQTARIGVATAELYPKFTLNGSIGLEALSSGNLFSSAARTLGVSPGFSWRLFEAGAIRQNIEVKSALQEQALIQYESAVLNALEEVENTLVAYAEEQQRRTALQKATEAAQRAQKLAQNKYQAGLIDFSEVLDAQRSLLSLQDQLAQSNGAVTSNLVRLYKSLGGGWEAMTPAGGLES